MKLFVSLFIQEFIQEIYKKEARRGGDRSQRRVQSWTRSVLEREKGNYNIFNWREYILYNTHCSNLQLINYIANNYKNKQKINIEQHVVCVERKNFGAT